MREAARAGAAHWHEAALCLLRLYQDDPARAEDAIAARIEDPGELAL
jgi:hypothetical protein